MPVPAQSDDKYYIADVDNFRVFPIITTVGSIMEKDL